jgi:DNA-binding GntR family transcriptional regulator
MSVQSSARPRDAATPGDVVRTSAYGAIKEMILGGKLRPGRKLVHEELAKTLGVSRTPVREACAKRWRCMRCARRRSWA